MILIYYQEAEKARRKYIGVLLQIGEYKYFAPLSSFKPKHEKMVETVDFIKIKNYAVINLNNMIPVSDGLYHLVDVNGIKEQNYKYLLQAENREINRQRKRILKNADIVYSHKKNYGDSTPLAKRTNDFLLLEKICKDY